MELKNEYGFKFIDGGVCAAKGFKANGLNCGLNSDKNKNDLGAVFSQESCNTACVYTQNKVKGAPIKVTKENLKKSQNISKAIIVNSKNANTCNANGIEIAETMCNAFAKELNIKPEEVIVASTGVIGQVLPIEPILSGIKPLITGLSEDGNMRVVNAIMTTDTVHKQVAVEFTVDNKTCHLGGMAKGSGMIHPNMATTLNFITTDCNISSEMLQCALSDVVNVTYNCLSIDGDTSTNDMVSLMANKLAGNIEINEKNKDYETFKSALYTVMVNLTVMLAADGEGASKLLECNCYNVKDYETAKTLAKSVIHSPLFKCAMFGADANCGRILCAMGYSGADFNAEKVDVTLKSKNGEIEVCKNGLGLRFSEEKAKEVLIADEIIIDINLNDGNEKATAWGCDLTYDYVKINGDYRS